MQFYACRSSTRISMNIVVCVSRGSVVGFQYIGAPTVRICGIHTGIAALRYSCIPALQTTVTFMLRGARQWGNRMYVSLAGDEDIFSESQKASGLRGELHHAQWHSNMHQINTAFDRIAHLTSARRPRDQTPAERRRCQLLCVVKHV